MGRINDVMLGYLNDNTRFADLFNGCCFHSPLKELFELLPYRRDKRALFKILSDNPVYRTLDWETAEAAAELIGAKNFLAAREKYEEGGTYNMCTAMKELMEDSRAEGFEAGLMEGRSQGLDQGIKQGFNQGVYQGKLTFLIEKICIKMQKGKSPEVIADELEQDPAAIALICHEVQNSAPDYHYSKIAARLDALGIIFT